jgi:hypothetical protein
MIAVNLDPVVNLMIILAQETENVLKTEDVFVSLASLEMIVKPWVMTVLPV